VTGADAAGNNPAAFSERAIGFEEYINRREER